MTGFQFGYILLGLFVIAYFLAKANDLLRAILKQLEAINTSTHRIRINDRQRDF